VEIEETSLKGIIKIMAKTIVFTIVMVKPNNVIVTVAMVLICIIHIKLNQLSLVSNSES